MSIFQAARRVRAGRLASWLLMAAVAPAALSQESPPRAGVVPAGNEAAPSPRKKEERVTGKAFLSVDRLPGGGQCRIVMVLTIQDGWHLKPNPPKVVGIVPTTFTVKSKYGTVLQKVQYPQGSAIDPDARDPRYIYEKQVAVYGVLSIPKDAAGQTEELELEVKYQACRGEDQCEFPTTLKLTGKLDVAPPGEAVGEINEKYFPAEK